MEQELKEAVERKKERMKHHGYAFEQDKQDDKMFVDLAESYLALKDCPQETNGIMIEKDVFGFSQRALSNVGYNQALKDCKLALLKKMDGISNVIISSAYPFLPTETETKVIKALKDHLTK